MLKHWIRLLHRRATIAVRIGLIKPHKLEKVVQTHERRARQVATNPNSHLAQVFFMRPPLASLWSPDVQKAEKRLDNRLHIVEDFATCQTDDVGRGLLNQRVANPDLFVILYPIVSRYHESALVAAQRLANGLSAFTCSDRFAATQAMENGVLVTAVSSPARCGRQSFWTAFHRWFIKWMYNQSDQFQLRVAGHPDTQNNRYIVVIA